MRISSGLRLDWRILARALATRAIRHIVYCSFVMRQGRGVGGNNLRRSDINQVLGMCAVGCGTTLLMWCVASCPPPAIVTHRRGV